MKKLTLILLPVLVLLLAACNLSSVPYAPVPPQTETVEWRNRNISISVDPSAEFMRSDLVKAAAQWSKAKYIDVSVLPAGAACPDGKVCPVMWGRTYTTPYLQMGWGVCNACRFYEDYGRVDAWFDTRWPAGPSRTNGACHEMGHGLSLAHGNVQGPCQGGVPTTWDLAVVDVVHDPGDL